MPLMVNFQCISTKLDLELPEQEKKPLLYACIIIHFEYKLMSILVGFSLPRFHHCPILRQIATHNYHFSIYDIYLTKIWNKLTLIRTSFIFSLYHHNKYEANYKNSFPSRHIVHVVIHVHMKSISEKQEFL